MSPVRLSRLEAAMRAVLAFVEAVNRQDVAGMVKLLSDDCILESASPGPNGSVHAGKDAVVHYWRDVFRQRPRVQVEVEEVFSLGERCVVRWRCAGARGADLFRVKNGLICEQRSYVKG